MIKTEIVQLRMNSKTISHYRNLGYDVLVNEKYDIKTSDLTIGSKINIVAICDICGKEKEIQYKEYLRNISNYNTFSCSNKCSTIKNRETSLKKYGTDHYSKTEEFINRMESTNLKKFGVEYYTMTQEYRDTMKKNNKNRDYSEMTKKSKNTSMLKYGVEDYHKSAEYENKKEEIINKYKKTITEKLINKYDNLISTDNSNYKFLCKDGHVFDISTINYYYIIDDVRKYRFNFRKDILVKNGFDSNKSEHEIMLDRKIYRIYDSGNLKFVWNKV